MANTGWINNSSSYITFRNLYKFTSIGNNSCTASGMAANGGGAELAIDIDDTLINYGTINSVQIKYTCYGNRTSTLNKKGTARTGYVISGDSYSWQVTHGQAVGRGSSNKTTFTDTFVPKRSTSDGKYHLLLGARNHIAAASLDVYFSDISIYIDYTPLETYTITTAVTPSGTGTVTGGGTFNSGATATLTATPATGYKFKQWNDGNTQNPRTVSVTGNATYTATFEKLTYRVRWYNEDGSQLLETDGAVPYGDMPVYNGATPTKPPTAQYTYTHIGWNVNPTTSGTVNLTAVVNNIDYYARFTSTTNKYQVTWLNYDGTVLEGAEWVPYGDPPSYDGATPTRPDSDDGKYTYKFLGWSVKDVDDGYYDESELEPVTGHITYEAVFLPVAIKYNLTIIAEDCTVNGAVSGDYDYGTEFTIKAIPDFGYKVSSIYFFDGKDVHIYEGDELTFILTDNTLVRPETIRLPAPILINLDQQIKDIYAVPEKKTIVYCVDGDLPTLNLNPIENMDTVKGWNFDVINTDIDEKYGIYSYYAVKRLFINDIRVW